MQRVGVKARLSVCASLLLTLTASAQTPARVETPQFVVEPGSHSRPINAISVNSTETLVVTGSSDKTVRLWDLRDGRLIRTIHLPIAPEKTGQSKEGEVYAVAISPDDKTIAYGGHTGFTWRNPRGSFFTYDREKNRIYEHPGFDSDIKTLSFGGNGKYLVYSTDANTTGIADRDNGYRTLPAFQVPGGIAGDVAHTPDGDVLAMLYRPPGKKTPGVFFRLYAILPQGLKMLGEAQWPVDTADSVRYTPDGKYLVVSSGETDDTVRRYDVFSGTSLDYLYALETKGTPIGFASPLPDSSGFAAPVLLDDTAKTAGLLTWRTGPKSATRTIKRLKDLRDDPETGLITPLKNGRFIWSSSWGDWSVMGGGTEFESYFDSINIGTTDTMGVSADGSEVFFQDNQPSVNDRQPPAVFSLKQRSLAANTALSRPNRYFATSFTVVPGLDVDKATLNGKALAMDEDDVVNSNEISPDGKVLYIGGGSEVYAFSRRDGTPFWKTQGLGSPVLQLRSTPDGKLVFACLQDGTFRWLSSAKGELKLSAFISGNRQKWIAWTPEGYYDASAGGEALGGWVVNRITPNYMLADFFGVSRFRAQYYRPDAVQAALTGVPSIVQRPPDTTITRGGPPATGLPPVVNIQRDHNLTLSTTDLTLNYTVSSPTPVTKVSARIDNRPVDTARGATPAGQTIQIQIPQRDCDVSIVAENSAGASEPDTIHVHWAGAVTVAKAKPVLWVVSIGISKYSQPGWALGLSAKDATDISSAFTAQKGRFYSDVRTTLLTNEQATRVGVLTALKNVKDKAKSDDFAVVFLSGHGVADTDRNYYYLPVDFVPDNYLTSGVSFDDITKLVSGIQARTIVFIDTCRSGGLNESRLSAIFDINRISNGLAESDNGGAVVFTAATGKQSALEREEWGNGAFTKALIEGLSGDAMLDDSGEVRLSFLNGWVSRRVSELTCGKQTPVFTNRGAPDFSIAQADKPAQKRAPSPCPVN
jgi:WD40 repeat protein